MSFTIIQAAIKQRRTITFEYSKSGKVQGRRIGNPHAVFEMHLKDGSKLTKVHIFQTGGVSDSSESLPAFRMFDLPHIINVAISEGPQSFEISSEYNPDWDGYRFALIKI